MDDDQFFIPVTVNGKEQQYAAVMRPSGYTIKIEVTVGDEQVIFEPDEERNWRAVIPYDNIPTAKRTDPAILQSIATALDELTK